MQLSQEFTGLVKNGYKVVNILGGALIISVFVYLFLGYKISSQHEQITPLQNDLFRTNLIIVAAVELIGVFIYRFYVFADERLRKKLVNIYDGLKNGTLPPLQNQNVSLDTIEKINALSLKERTLHRMLGTAFTPYILIFAIQESIAIYGLILTFTTHDFMEMVPFASTTLVLHFSMLGFVHRVINRAESIVGHPRFGEEFK